MSVGRIGLVQHYWYKVPVLHIIKYHLTSAWYRYLIWYKSNQKNGFEAEKVKDGYRQCGYLPQPPTSHEH